MHFSFGHSKVYPNMYAVLMGAPAARKSAAINIGTGLLRAVRYKQIAPERMSREAFLDELKRINEPDLEDAGDIEALLDAVDADTSEFTIHAGEFIDFMGQGDKDYLMLLTTLYDNLDVYRNPKVARKAVDIRKPTINLLGAATPENLNMAFPANMMDTGTLSRFLFIFSTPNKEKVLIPTGCLDPAAELELIDTLGRIRQLEGEAKLNAEAMELLDGIYKLAEPLKDPRFSFYSGRRLSHLIKLSIIQAVSRLSLEITAEDILIANTVLCAAEARMPQALGNFGVSRNSQTTHNMLAYIEARPKRLTVADLYKIFASDFTKQGDFQQVMQDLAQADRIKLLKMPDARVVLDVVTASIPKWATDLMMPDILTDQEREAIGL